MRRQCVPGSPFSSPEREPGFEATHQISVNMAWKAVLLLASVLIHLTGGEDLYWAYSTNWNEPSNWALKRAPCGGDTVRVSLVVTGSQTRPYSVRFLVPDLSKGG